MTRKKREKLPESGELPNSIQKEEGYLSPLFFLYALLFSFFVKICDRKHRSQYKYNAQSRLYPYRLMEQNSSQNHTGDGFEGA